VQKKKTVGGGKKEAFKEARGTWEEPVQAEGWSCPKFPVPGQNKELIEGIGAHVQTAVRKSGNHPHGEAKRSFHLKSPQKLQKKRVKDMGSRITKNLEKGKFGGGCGG